MFCTKCGANIADGSKFCTRCGAAANAAPPIISAEPAAPAPVPKEKNNRTLMIILIAALAVAVIAGIVLTVVLLSGANSPEQLWQEQYDLGNRYLSDGEYEEAAIAFLAAIDIDPKRPEAYRGAADAYIAMGDYESASEILDRGAEETGEEEMRSESEQILHQMQEPSLPDQKKLTQICRYNSNGALDIEYVFSYDEKDRIVGIRYIYHTGESTDEYVYHLSYDEAGRLLLYSTGDPSDLSSYGFTQYEYNDAGQLTRRVNKEGSSSEELYEYDAQGLLTRSVETNDFYEQTTDYFHNETGQLIYKERYNNLYSDIEAYYYEYDGQGRITVETYEMAPYESTSTYDYSYKNFVLIQPDDGYDRLVMQDIMGHEIFSLAFQAPQFSANAEGFLTEISDIDYTDEQVTYAFIYEGGAEPQAPAETEPVPDWQAEYASFIKELAGDRADYEREMMRFSLFYLDDDDIPELWIDGGGYAAGCHMAYFSGDSLQSQMFAYSYPSYMERENLLHLGSGHQGVYGDSVYSLKDGELIAIARGNYTEIINPADGSVNDAQSEYFWEDTKVSAAQYQQSLEEAFDSSSAKDFYSTPSYSYDEILAYLE